MLFVTFRKLKNTNAVSVKATILYRVKFIIVKLGVRSFGRSERLSLQPGRPGRSNNNSTFTGKHSATLQ